MARNALVAFKGQKTMQRKGMESLLSRLAMLLLGVAVYRFGSFIPVPGIDVNACAEHFKQLGSSENFLGSLDNFFGGTLSRASIFAVGLSPYITSSIVMRFLTLSFPSLKALQNEGGLGRHKLNSYMRYGTLLLAFAQSMALVLVISGQMPGVGGRFQGMLTLPAEGLKLYFIMVPCFTAWAIFVMWLCEQMSERGLGSGTSMLILTNQLCHLLSAISKLATGLRGGTISVAPFLGFVVAAYCVLYAVAFLEMTQRRIPVHYPHRPEVGRISPLPPARLPLKFNSSDIMPAIVAGTLTGMLGTGCNFLAGWFPDSLLLRRLMHALQSMGPLYLLLNSFFLIVAVYLYTNVNFDCWETSENLRKEKAYLSGIRPGPQTAHYLQAILDRMVRLAAIYLVCTVVLLPMIFGKVWGKELGFSGVSLLIVVGVVVELIESVLTHIYSHRYGEVLKRTSFWRLNRSRTYA